MTEATGPRITNGETAEVNWVVLSHNELPLSPVPRLYRCPPKLASEAISSWIYRIAASYSWSPAAISKLVGGTLNPAALDFAISKEIMRRIATVAVCSATVFTSPLVRGMSALKRTHLRHLIYDTHGLPRYRFCPICLSEDEVPHIRLHWRLATTILCEHHKVLLTDRCPSCLSRVRLGGRENIAVPESGPVRTLCYCPTCRAPFIEAYSPLQVSARMTAMVAHFQNLAVELFERGSTRDPAFSTFGRSDFLTMFMTKEIPLYPVSTRTRLRYRYMIPQDTPPGPKARRWVDWGKIVHPGDFRLLARCFKARLDP